jgi:hypothetical protein
MMRIELSYRYVLVNKDETEDELPIDGFAYRQLLSEAVDHGWEPAGTSEPSDWRDIDYNDASAYQLAMDEHWSLPGSYVYNYDDDEEGHSFHFILDPDKTWDSNYTSTQGQEVTAQDATAIADALQKALDSVADYDMHKRELTHSEIAEVETEVQELFEKDGKECPDYAKALATEHIRRGLLLERDLKQIIAFCRKGAFLIY